MLSVRKRTVPAADFRTGVELLGAINGTNQTFTTPEVFIHEPPGIDLALYWNGVRQRLNCDYTVAGPASGQGQTITTLFTPRDGDILLADYVVVSTP